MDCQKPFYDPFIVLLLTLVYIFFHFLFLVSIIKVFICSCNFLEDPSVNHFRDVGFHIKDYPQNADDFFLSMPRID